jgi:RNA polymerase sigma factor (TIGR02999 family)
MPVYRIDPGESVESSRADITELLNRAASGDPDAGRDVLPAIYRELKNLASARLAKIPPGGTLQTTALVHEAWLRIVNRNPAGWEGMRHFYFTAARAMRDILVEEARRKLAAKRGGGAEHVVDMDVAWSYDTSPEEVLALDTALSRLKEEDEEGHRLVLLRYYAGLTVPEVADVLGSSVRTVERKWRFLRSWLSRQLEAPATG